MTVISEHHFSTRLHQSTAPFSHFVRHGDVGYTTGIIGQRPDDGSLVSDDVAEQCEAMMTNLQTLLDELDLNSSSILRTTIYFTDYKDSTLSTLFTHTA
ncbi:RidA family protein [Citricoccus sp. GCM10030269]|uniref:RidA family protein n=1 Tax=Citricoccus sp. GCM10030269 TaxID=3273388 RepID=UPI003621A1D2